MQPTRSCKQFIPSFAAALKKVDINRLPVTDYCKRYLGHLLAHSGYYLNIYAHVLDNVIERAALKKEELHLLDYGAGNGLLGLFAKYCGFNKVLLCDNDADFIDASKQLSALMNISIDGFIEGDITDVQNSALSFKIHAIAGTDVIEHIYDLNDFFRKIHIMNPAMLSVFTTASNPDNLFKTRQLKKLQLKDELTGSDPGDFILAGAEKHEAFIVMREKIIKDHFPELKEEEVLRLARLTRGLNEPDIIKAVHGFLLYGITPVLNWVQYNTCNPKTGSWTERILSISKYQRIYAAHGFTLTVRNGFYNTKTAGIKKMFNILLNILIKISGRKIAPFITLIGYKQS